MAAKPPPKTGAERARAFRERKRLEKEKAEAEARANAPLIAPTTQRDALEKSLEAMKWLTDSDGAAIALARAIATQVDVQMHAGDVAKALSAAGRLTTLLDRLGGTPTVRMAHELRSLRLAAASEEKGTAREGHTETPEARSGVLPFQRPPRRSGT